MPFSYTLRSHIPVSSIFESYIDNLSHNFHCLKVCAQFVNEVECGEIKLIAIVEIVVEGYVFTNENEMKIN